jgi:uncharacterized membrane protein YedE/YeeE
MARHLASLLAGLLLGLGLAVSGMSHPEKVLGFLDLAGQWDPSLLFVLGGAVGVSALTFHFILRRPRPRFAARFHLPVAQDIDRPLLLGAVLFGIGWGIGGYCPGPAIAMLAAPNWETWVFLPAMLGGALLHQWLAASLRARALRRAAVAAPDAETSQQ